jgi:hypothetical protein
MDALKHTGDRLGPGHFLLSEGGGRPVLEARVEVEHRRLLADADHLERLLQSLKRGNRPPFLDEPPVVAHRGQVSHLGFVERRDVGGLVGDSHLGGMGEHDEVA